MGVNLVEYNTTYSCIHKRRLAITSERAEPDRGTEPDTRPDDATGRGVLSGAYANRGIPHDRLGRYEAALADYERALAIDPGAVEGPGLFHRILYGNTHPGTVRNRAEYLRRQLALPESERLLRVPELDGRQRMYKP